MMRANTLAMFASSAFALGLAVLALSPATSQAQENPVSPVTLKSASEFESIADPSARAVALFTEAGKVIQHPRCINCHPATDRPLQGIDMKPHQPPVSRGPANIGMPGMMCSTCHGVANVAVVGQSDTLRSIPGHPLWHVAPIEMAWEGKSLGQICEQIKDPARNGGKTMDEIVEHMAKDTLVGWGWNPGEGREPAPGTQDVFGELIARWAADGAACPKG